MNEKYTLVIMAAGSATRYGKLKQLEEIGPNNELIIDYSIYDAIKAGYTKIIFVIKEETYNLFKESIGKRIEDKIKVEYVFQNTINVSAKYPNRIKPWGTGHAVLITKDKIDGSFSIINADDFYGREAFIKSIEFMKQNSIDFGLMAYKINQVLKNNQEKRGILTFKNNYLEKIEENVINIKNNQIYATNIETNQERILEENTKVSMNFISFNKNVFNILEQDFNDFLKLDLTEKDEFMIPVILNNNIQKNNFKIQVIPVDSFWTGLTHQEDKQKVIQDIKKLIDKKEYPNKLWE